MKPTLLIGAPGTGKTYQLIEKIKERKPDRFALVSFTRRAANEAKQRLRLFYSDRDLRYVRTIHSLCFELLGLHTNQVMTFQHLRAFGEEYGYEFTNRSFSQEDGTYYGLTDDDREYREMMISIAKQGADHFTSNMGKNYRKFKQENSLIDYHDMLIKGTQLYGAGLSFDLLCVDETQDLSPLQWEFIITLQLCSPEVIYAGDGNQMIFEWAGVDRQKYLELEKNCQVEELIENYRLDYGLNQFANKILGFDPYSHVACSSVKYINYLPEFNPDETYLILARNNYILRNMFIYNDIQNEITQPWAWLHLYEQPNIKVHLSTIHGAKGAEADNVILFTDVSPATYENIDSEAEKRVWYVGITRARKKLYIMEPQTQCFYDLS